MKLHCIYCGSTLNVTKMFYHDEPPRSQAERLAFEQMHDRECGPKSVGMIADLATPQKQKAP